MPGAVILLAGEPGVGKSTLLLTVAANAARQAKLTGAGSVLYITGEESASQVRLRAARIDALADNLLLAAETELGAVLGQVEQANPALLIVDSVQTIASADVEGSAGGTSQVRAVAAAIIALAKERNIPVLLVGHVTKDGGIAGPRVLEHLVDVVCQFEGERHARLRLLRAVKTAMALPMKLAALSWVNVALWSWLIRLGCFCLRPALRFPAPALPSL